MIKRFDPQGIGPESLPIANGVEFTEQAGVGSSMKRRLAVWSLVGFIVACGWALFVMAMPPQTAFAILRSHPLRTIIEVTAPASLLRPLKYYWFILLNALIYSLVGLGTELLRRNSARRLSN